MIRIWNTDLNSVQTYLSIVVGSFIFTCDLQNILYMDFSEQKYARTRAFLQFSIFNITLLKQVYTKNFPFQD